jgi:DNA topoisomerase I
MSYELIITEKPQAAKKIADALGGGKVTKGNIKSVPYFSLRRAGKDIVVGCAVGHLYTVSEKEKGKWAYPVFDVNWVPSSEVSKSSAFSGKYLAALKTLAKDAKTFTIACDYDIEGEVIGYNVIRFICKQKDARRMKFSTLTQEDLVRSYDNVQPHLDWGQALAGVTRHELDWYYGINLSRALTLAVKTSGLFKVLSSGRVQGPALKIIVDREKEISAFKPVPFWVIELDGLIHDHKVLAVHVEDKFWDKQKASAVLSKTKGNDGRVDSVDKNEFQQAPPAPFDLTTLQTEAYRSFRMQPKKTLEVAQSLYIEGLISYPRTSSQKLPKEIGYEKIITQIMKQDYYKALAAKLLAKKGLTPNEGQKNDPAHPAIYPTGIIAPIAADKARVYDLILRRFLATFADPCKRETVSITIDVKSEHFVAKGTRTVEKGWHEFYGPHVKVEDQTMPACAKGDPVKVEEIRMLDKETQPPKRYTPASIIRDLENRNLGTKATRAQIIDSLYDRGYVRETSIQATALGINTCETLMKYSPEILDEELTRHFEEEMDKIRDESVKPATVLSEAKKKLTEVLTKFKKKEKEIGKALSEALTQTRDELTNVGPCPVCKVGMLSIRRGKFGSFIACDKYPECKTTFKLPAGKIKVTKDPCPECSYPTILISRGKKPQKVCINEKCPTKNNHSAAAQKETQAVKDGTVTKVCPKCGKPLVVRRSIYGEFYGCSGFPKCRHTERIAKQ